MHLFDHEKVYFLCNINAVGQVINNIINNSNLPLIKGLFKLKSCIFELLIVNKKY